MKLLAFDTETYLIGARDKAPKPVCCTWHDGHKSFITHPGDATTYALLHDKDTVFCGVNIAYDLLVLMRWHPALIPAIIQAVDEGRMLDLCLRDGLIHLATKGAAGYNMTPSLADLAQKHLGIDLSANKKGDDIWRLKFGTLDGVPFNQWPTEALNYALDDAKHTYNICLQLGDPFKLYPTEEAQNQGALALAAIGVWGFKVNQTVRGKLKDAITKQINELHEQTKHLGWTGKGSKARMAAVVIPAWKEKQLKEIAHYCKTHNAQVDIDILRERVNTPDIKTTIASWASMGRIPADIPLQFQENADPFMSLTDLFNHMSSVPMTKTGVSISEECLELIADEMPTTTLPDGTVVNYGKAYVELKHKIKMHSTYIEPYAHETAHPRFVPMVASGRTGCRGDGHSSGNLQNIPRRDKTKPEEAFRTMFEARPGRLLGTVDYSQLELCTLAATIRVFFPDIRCMLGEAIDANIDAHCVTGSQIAGVSYEQMMAKKKESGSVEANARQASKACFSGDTELLTRKGWRKISDLCVFEPNTEIMQYCPHTKTLTFTKPIGWVNKKESRMVRVTSSFMDQLVTEDHRLLFISKASGHTSEVLAQDAHTVKENSLSVHGGYYNNEKERLFSDLETRLAVMVQADGSYKSKNVVSLGFTKQRKVQRCKKLLDEAGLQYDFRYVGELRVPTFFVSNRKEWCKLDENKSFLSWDKYDGEAFIDEIWRWDGSVAKKHTHVYSNTKLKDVICAQTILSCFGKKTALATGYPTKEGHSPVHTLCWYVGDRKKNTEYCRCSGLTKTMIEGDTQVYCPSVPTSWLLTRRKGKVVVSGNCNFGLPGGLGAKAFVSYAKNNYGVELNVNQARHFISVWKQTWPEMNVYLRDAGNVINNAKGGRGVSFTINGFTRADCFYTEYLNTKFQSLAAEGAKRALWAVYREQMLGWFWKNNSGFGYGCDLRDGALAESKTVNFVHDEIVCEHPEGDAGKAALKRQEKLMVDTMTKTCHNKITIRVEGALSAQWEH